MAQKQDPFAFDASVPPNPALEDVSAPPTLAGTVCTDAEAVERATHLSSEAYERLPPEMKAAIQVRKAEAQRLTEAFERAFRRRALCCAIGGAVLTLMMLVLLPISSALFIPLVLAQGAASGYWIVAAEASPLGGVVRFGLINVLLCNLGFVLGMLNWTGAASAFIAWLFACGGGGMLAHWARSQREKVGAF